jgi:inhibitor of cysteine peptidase
MMARRGVCGLAVAALVLMLPMTESRAESMIKLEKGKRASTTARPGDLLEIRLPAVPGTGYSWQVDEADAKMLSFVDTRFESRGAEGPRVGAEVDQIITMKATGEGQAEIRLSYRRPWEKSAPTDDTAVLRVTVGK